MKFDFQEILKTIGDARNILVTTHIYPDGDALGSQLGLGHLLESLGKNVYLYSDEEVNYIYAFLPGSDRLQTVLPETARFDCAVVLDCGDRFRLGKCMDKVLDIHPLVMIDHHDGNNGFGDLCWVDSGRASTGEMVFDLAAALNVELTYDAAYCLYAAIVSDTGSFKYSSTTADTFRIASELISRGVNPAEVAGNLFDNFTKNRLQLMKDVLSTLEFYENDKIAFIHVTREMFEQSGATREDTETFINYPRSLKSVSVAVFIKEVKNDQISVSLRSKGENHDVAAVASCFGGGGHRNAAGFKVTGESVVKVRDRLLKEILPVVTEG